jgi:hypothetical protein
MKMHKRNLLAPCFIFVENFPCYSASPGAFLKFFSFCPAFIVTLVVNHFSYA